MIQYNMIHYDTENDTVQSQYNTTNIVKAEIHRCKRNSFFAGNKGENARTREVHNAYVVLFHVGAC